MNSSFVKFTHLKNRKREQKTLMTHLDFMWIYYKTVCVFASVFLVNVISQYILSDISVVIYKKDPKMLKYVSKNIYIQSILISYKIYFMPIYGLPFFGV